MLLLGNSSFKNLWRINILDGNFSYCSWWHFTTTKLWISGKSPVVVSLVGPSEAGNLQPKNNWLAIGTFASVFKKNSFLSAIAATLRCYAESIHSLIFFQLLSFQFVDPFRKNGAKYLLVFDNSSEKICNSKTFLDEATAGRYRRLSVFYMNHNLVHQSKLGWDVELQNTHIVPFQSLREVMQFDTRSWVSDQSHMIVIES